MVKRKGTAKGVRKERELVNKLHEAGFGALRAPASGGATKRGLPDVIAGNGDTYLIFECKASELQEIYISKEQIDGLLDFGQRFGALPFIAAAFNYKGWFFIDPIYLESTQRGNYKLTFKRAFDLALRWDDLMELCGKCKI